jgi:hypothetical protein
MAAENRLGQRNGSVARLCSTQAFVKAIASISSQGLPSIFTRLASTPQTEQTIALLDTFAPLIRFGILARNTAISLRVLGY